MFQVVKFYGTATLTGYTHIPLSRFIN